MFYYFLKEYTPQKQAKKVFKTIRDVPSAFNDVSTATDYNFKATKLKVIPQYMYCIAHPYCAAHDFFVISGANERVHVQNERNFPQAKFDNEINVPFLLNEHGDLFFIAQ